MLNKISNFISVAFHPLLMSTYGTLLLFYQVESYLKYIYSPDAKKFITLLIVLFTFLSPALLSIFLVYQKQVSSISMKNRRERWLPILLTFILYITAFLVLNKYGINQAITTLILSSTVAIGITFFITLFWKISAHMIGICGLAGAMYGLIHIYQLPLVPYLSLTFLIAGFIGFARLQLEQHNLSQILAGAVLGFGTCFLTLKLFL